MSVRSDIIDNLETAITAVKDSTSYPLTIKEVNRFDINRLVSANATFPMVVIVDVGGDRVLVQDGSQSRIAMPIGLLGAVSGDTTDELGDNLSKMTSWLEQFIASSPSLGDQVLGIQFGQVRGNSYQVEPTKRASTAVDAEIIYYVDAGSY